MDAVTTKNENEKNKKDSQELETLLYDLEYTNTNTCILKKENEERNFLIREFTDIR